jgi:hypothetical protein
MLENPSAESVVSDWVDRDPCGACLGHGARPLASNQRPRSEERSSEHDRQNESVRDTSMVGPSPRSRSTLGHSGSKCRSRSAGVNLIP